MISRREIFEAKVQIQELLRSVKLTAAQRDHYMRELADLELKLRGETSSSKSSAAAGSD